VTNLCEIEELCQYDRSCPFYADNCRHDRNRMKLRIAAPTADQEPAKAPIPSVPSDGP